jgi:hypothetical protein
MYTVGIRVPTRQIRSFSTFSVSSALRHIPSARCVIAENNIYRCLDIFNKNIVSFEDTFTSKMCLDLLFVSVQFCFILFLSCMFY